MNMHNSDELKDMIDSINHKINSAIEYERFHIGNSSLIYPNHDDAREKIMMLEEERKRMIEQMIDQFEKNKKWSITKIDTIKNEIKDAIDDFYRKEGLSDNDDVDIIVRKVGKKYVAARDNRRDQKIKEILE